MALIVWTSRMEGDFERTLLGWEQMECNYSIIRFSRKTTSLQMSVVLSTATSLNGWRRCCGDMKPRILRTLN